MRMKKSTIMEGGEEQHYRKGLWTTEEDRILMDYVKLHGKGNWNHIPKKTGLKRCGKSCRLRWMNYLSPSVNKGDFTQDEEDLIIRLHNLLGNRWSLIAKRVPGRTDNQVKNYWNTHLSKKVSRTKRQNHELTDSSLTNPMRLDFHKNIGTETSANTSTTIISNQIIPKDHKGVQHAFDHVYISETQESTIAEGFVMNPSWISDDHDFDLGYTFTMMEFLEGYYSTIF